MRLIFPSVCLVGLGELNRMGEDVKRLGSKALVVTGRGSLRRAGVLERTLELLSRSGLKSSIFEGVPPEPDLASVDAVRSALKESRSDVVIGLGGGSVIDAAKAGAALAYAGEPTSEFHRGKELPEPALPVVAVPTTSGTGAEATRNSVILDPEVPVKKSIRGDSFLPALAVIDGELTRSCPPLVTAHSGMDALTQAIESFVSNQSGPATDALASKAIELIAGSLLTAYENGENEKARMAVAEGSFLAGVALCNARLGAVHGMAHPIGAIFHLPHGLVCAVLLPAVLHHNWEAISNDKKQFISSILGPDPINTIYAFMEKMGIPRRFEHEPDENQIASIINYALSSGSSKANPVKVDEHYVHSILRNVFPL